MGDAIFLAGFVLETVALVIGVHSWAVGFSLVVYGGVLLLTGYLR